MLSILKLVFHAASVALVLVQADVAAVHLLVHSRGRLHVSLLGGHLARSRGCLRRHSSLLLKLVFLNRDAEVAVGQVLSLDVSRVSRPAQVSDGETAAACVAHRTLHVQCQLGRQGLLVMPGCLLENHRRVTAVGSHDVLHGLLLASHATAAQEQVRLSLALLALVGGLTFPDTVGCCRQGHSRLLLMADDVVLPLLLAMADLGGLRREEMLLM